MTRVARTTRPTGARAHDAALRAIFQDLAKLARLSNDQREVALDRARATVERLPRDPLVLEALDRVVGRNERRRRDAVHVLAALADVPGGLERLRASLADERAEARAVAAIAIADCGD